MFFECCLKRTKHHKKRESQTEFQSNGLQASQFIQLKYEQLSDYYEIIDIVGEGAYGTVNKVKHKQSHLIRAMKTIQKYLVKESTNKLFKEVEILRSLDHPHIIQIYEIYHDEDNYYVIMEYLQGGELFDHIQNLQHFSEKIAANYLKQLLSAVSYCHSLNIVHRDLKPENILMDSKEIGSNLKIIDFGASKRQMEEQTKGKIIGTPYYMAPETFDGIISEKCDIWACGIILHILLFGNPPFSGNNNQTIINNIRKGKATLQNKDWSTVSKGAKKLILKMLNYDHKERISAQEALQDGWIQDNTITEQINTQQMQLLSEFHQKSKLQAGILLFMSTQITNYQEKEELIRTFKQMDVNHDGILSKEELIEGYQTIYDKNKAIKIVEELLLHVDVNCSGSIDYSEFVLAAINKANLVNSHKLEATFKMFDTNGDGFLSRQELSNILGCITVDDNQWEQFLIECDDNHDGQISQSEFINMLSKKN